MNFKSASVIVIAIIAIVAAFVAYEPAEFDEYVSYERHTSEYDASASCSEVATIVSVNDELVTVETNEGELFAFEGTGFKVGSDITIVFDNDERIINAY